jgi:uncharacterized protein DUF3775
LSPPAIALLHRPCLGTTCPELASASGVDGDQAGARRERLCCRARRNVALAWLGRDDNTIDDWQGLREEAQRAHGTRTTHTADYLLGIPLLGDYPDEGLSLFGRPCEAFQR